MSSTPLKASLILGSAVALTAIIPAAMAQDSGRKLIIENFVGTLKINTDDTLDLDIVEAKNDRRVNVTRRNGNMIIDGGIAEPNRRDCQGSYGSYSLSWFKSKPREGQFGGYKNLKDYPTLTLDAPKDVSLVIRNAIPFATIGDIESADIDLMACGKIYLGDIAAPSRFDISGSGDITAEVINDIEINLSGSGDIEIEQAADVSLKQRGSGDVEIDQAQDAVIKMSGSGDFDVEKLNRVQIRATGSGDMRIDTILAGLDLTGRGSGDFRADEVSGDVSIDMSGSGDVTIDSGDIPTLVITVSGSSDVRFDGRAETAELEASGSGDITVDEVTGSLKRRESGSADIRVSN